MYAVVSFLGKQIKIEEGKNIKIPFHNKKIGSKVKLDNILFLTDGKKEKETPIEACRVATMGRLSELGLIKWKIGPNTSSEYTISEKAGDLL